jgi:hypothetical protein
MLIQQGSMGAYQYALFIHLLPPPTGLIALLSTLLKRLLWPGHERDSSLAAASVQRLQPRPPRIYVQTCTTRMSSDAWADYTANIQLNIRRTHQLTEQALSSCTFGLISHHTECSGSSCFVFVWGLRFESRAG